MKTINILSFFLPVNLKEHYIKTFKFIQKSKLFEFIELIRLSRTTKSVGTVDGSAKQPAEKLEGNDATRILMGHKWTSMPGPVRSVFTQCRAVNNALLIIYLIHIIYDKINMDNILFSLNHRV
jgi:hypothetical protein